MAFIITLIAVITILIVAGIYSLIRVRRLIVHWLNEKGGTLLKLDSIVFDESKNICAHEHIVTYRASDGEIRWAKLHVKKQAIRVIHDEPIESVFFKAKASESILNLPIEALAFTTEDTPVNRYVHQTFQSICKDSKIHIIRHADLETEHETITHVSIAQFLRILCRSQPSACEFEGEMVVDGQVFKLAWSFDQSDEGKTLRIQRLTEAIPFTDSE